MDNASQNLQVEKHMECDGLIYDEAIEKGEALPHLSARAKLIIYNPSIDERLSFGPGVADICKGVREFGSLQSAAKAMGMSYTKAWKIIGEAEEAMGIKLVGRQKPKGFWLTPAGNKMLDGYISISESLNQYTRFLAEQYYD